MCIYINLYVHISSYVYINSYTHTHTYYENTNISYFSCLENSRSPFLQ